MFGLCFIFVELCGKDVEVGHPVIYYSCSIIKDGIFPIHHCESHLSFHLIVELLLLYFEFYLRQGFRKVFNFVDRLGGGCNLSNFSLGT